MKPTITVDDYKGYHNTRPKDVIIKGNSYKDLSTICIVPTRGVIPAKVVQSWMGMMTPMNQKFIRIFAEGMEVGEAYSVTIDNILASDELSKWKYVLTLEEDNCPPPDGLLKLLENMDKFDAIGGLYWTKGEGGKPMIYGDPTVQPMNFIPFIPKEESIVQCNGLGMGFTLFSMKMLKDPRLPRPLFKTTQQYTPGIGVQAYTQDLKFFEDAGRLGYKFACDTRVKVGHWDQNGQFMW